MTRFFSEFSVRQKKGIQRFLCIKPRFMGLNPFPNKPWFLRACNSSLLKTLREKEKLLVTSNFSFSHSVFYPFGELSAIFIQFEIVVCKHFDFGRVKDLSFGKGLSRAICTCLWVLTKAMCKILTSIKFKGVLQMTILMCCNFSLIRYKTLWEKEKIGGYQHFLHFP